MNLMPVAIHPRPSGPRPLWPRPLDLGQEMVFGAVDLDEDGPVREVTLDQGNRRTQAERLQRLQTRAALYAAPDTLCSAQEFADVMGLRVGRVRALDPEGMCSHGRSRRAPFRAWLHALDGDPPFDHAVRQALSELRAARRPTRRPRRKLTPLGGPDEH